MASPASGAETPRDDLAAMVELDLQATWAGFIGMRLFPVTPVAEASGVIPIVDLNERLTERDTRRAPGGTYQRSNEEYTTTTFACEEHGAEEPIDDRERRVFGAFIDSDASATVRATDAVLRNAERRIAAIALAATGTTAAGNVWSGASGTPIANVKTAKIAIRNRTGLNANAGACDWEVFEHLRTSDEIRGILKYQGFVDMRPEEITVSAVASALGLGVLLVAGAGDVRNTANQGQSTVSLSAIWDRTQFLVGVINPSPDTRVPTAGRVFHYIEDGSMVNGTVEQYRENQTRSDVVRVRHDVDEKLIYDGALQRITGVLS